MRTLKQLLQDRQYFKQVMLFYDIETYQYNEKQGKVFPSRYKNMTFSVAVSWVEAGEVEYEVFPNFKEVFDVIITTYQHMSKKPLILLNAHNSNKYDNHFLRKDLVYYYPEMQIKNYWLTTATTEKSNEWAHRIKDLTKKQKKEGVILEKRVKSSINLEMIIYIAGIKIQTVDNFIKTNASIAMLGKKLQRLGVVSEEELKTDFEYTKHNRPDDLTEKEAREYAKEIYESLTVDELTYIQNDVILLAKSYYYYADLFNGFDYKKMTFTSNILEAYNDNDVTSFQLLNRIGEGQDREAVRYTDYKFANQNFYDYLKPFYRGGLNFYNHFHIGKIITDGVFGMDIHSSYPYAMHDFKIPTFLKGWNEFEEVEHVRVEYEEDTFSLYQMSKKDFDEVILDKIQSVIVKQMLVKYYTTNETININSYTFKLLRDVVGVHLTTVPVYSKVTFETTYFGSRDQIDEFYKIKTIGSTTNKIEYTDPYTIETVEGINKEVLSPEEYDNSKVLLNGLYGIPALRAYFNLFRRNEEGEYVNIENGHKNAERNIVFSIFVTSVALWNLLTPFQYLTPLEIDENFLYSDTDSLYFKKTIQHKLPDTLFTDYSLGTWDLEHENMQHFYVLNHKKYAYTDDEGTIQVKAGGIPNDSFDTDMSFEQFINTQFSDGVEVDTLKSIYNEQETISIYPSKTKLEVGKGYRLYTYDPFYEGEKEKMFEAIREQVDEFTSDVLYIESSFGTFSLSDLFPYTHEVKNKEPLVFLQITQERIKGRILD